MPHKKCTIERIFFFVWVYCYSIYMFLFLYRDALLSCLTTKITPHHRFIHSFYKEEMIYNSIYSMCVLVQINKKNLYLLLITLIVHTLPCVFVFAWAFWKRMYPLCVKGCALDWRFARQCVFVLLLHI